MSWLERKIPLPSYSNPLDEKINTNTHLFGTCLAFAGFLAVLGLNMNIESIALKSGLIIFALSNILLYLSSTLYHGLKPGNLKRLFRILDHSNIYILIAGTYTPLLLYIGTRKAMILLFAMWLLAYSGITLTLLFWKSLKIVHVLLYLLMGWLCIFFYSDIFPYIPPGLIKLLILGGISYTSGLVFYAAKKIPHSHGIWHVFVLLGSIFFYTGILYYLS